MRLAGYKTVAYPDHPYFYNHNANVSLIRGFEKFNVINDYETYASYTNIGTEAGRLEHRRELTGLEMPDQELWERIRRFRSGEQRFDLDRDADFDPESQMHFAKLYELFRGSDYFRLRYGSGFDGEIFSKPQERPYFLFLNLHMSTAALPDPGLYLRWALRTLLLNAQHRDAKLDARQDGEDLWEWVFRTYSELGLSSGAFRSPQHFLKQVFDNRFYDACFRGVWEYLEERGLTRNTVTIVTSDHGLSFGEHGEHVYLHAGARPHDYMTRVPLVIRFPEGSELAGHHGRYPERVSLTDLFLTVVELAVGRGVFERELPVRGQSIVDRLRERRFETVFVAEASMVPDTYDVLPSVAGYSKAIYSGDLKLIFSPRLLRMAQDAWPVLARLTGDWLLETPPPAFEDVGEPLALLYDLREDPHERHNLAPTHPEEVERLRALAGAWSCQPRPWQAQRPDWDHPALETLRSLGYIH
jgi:hypothetical protein